MVNELFVTVYIAVNIGSFLKIVAMSTSVYINDRYFYEYDGIQVIVAISD